MIDYRSDTVTQPTQAMLDAMYKAKLGDDVFGEDATVNELEHYCAEMFGYKAAVFCPSGTMTNQIAIKVHTKPGDEVICDKTSHVYQYEGGGIAFNSGCSVRLIDGDKGRITANDVLQNINADDVHKPVSKLVCLENTANRGGGSCYNFNAIKNIKEVCLQQNLILHLDGARLFNAIVANNENAIQYGEVFDSISICLSKGLGAPVGSILLGNTNFIKQARRVRKVFGGGMRQAGSLAAAGLYALQNNINRLATDHSNAKKIAVALAATNYVGKIFEVTTNIIIFEVKGKYSAAEFVQQMKNCNILLFAISSTHVRMVVHLNITTTMIDTTIQTISQL